MHRPYFTHGDGPTCDSHVDGGSAALPFVRMFYGAPSEYLWEDSGGATHRIPQGEGGQQGDALMPLLFAVSQHSALEAAGTQLWPGDRIFAYLDDITPERVGAVYAIVEERNRAGERPQICDVLERIARLQNPRAVVWRRSGYLVISKG